MTFQGVIIHIFVHYIEIKWVYRIYFHIWQYRTCQINILPAFPSHLTLQMADDSDDSNDGDTEDFFRFLI